MKVLVFIVQPGLLMTAMHFLQPSARRRPAITLCQDTSRTDVCVMTQFGWHVSCVAVGDSLCNSSASQSQG